MIEGHHKLGQAHAEGQPLVIAPGHSIRWSG
jgi:hypothetical protein